MWIRRLNEAKISSQANILASRFPKLIPESMAASFEGREEDYLEIAYASILLRYIQPNLF